MKKETLDRIGNKIDQNPQKKNHEKKRQRIQASGFRAHPVRNEHDGSPFLAGKSFASGELSGVHTSDRTRPFPTRIEFGE